MINSPNLKWKCMICGKELDAHEEEESCSNAIPPECPKCNVYMVGGPIIHRDPPFQNPFRKD